MESQFPLPYNILFMVELEKKNSEEVDNCGDMVEIYRCHLFHLGTWERSVKGFCGNPQWNSPNNFVEILNEIHPTIKFITEWSQKSTKFLDVTVSLINSHIETDLYVKPTDSQQNFHFSRWHPYHRKKNILYSHSLRFNRIYSKNNFFYIYCSNFWDVKVNEKNFKKRKSDQICHIHKPLNCNSKNTGYHTECNQCWKQYTGRSKTKSCYRANNYTNKSSHRKSKNKKQVCKTFSTNTFAQMTTMVFKIS